MGQHKPKVDHLKAEGYQSPFQADQPGEVIFQESGSQTLLPGEVNYFFARSLFIKSLGLIISLDLAWLFFSHYSGSSVHQILGIDRGIALTVLVGISIVLSFLEMKRQVLTEKAALISGGEAKPLRLTIRPFLSYLGWTFLFFLLPFLGHSVFPLLFATYMISRSGIRRSWIVNNRFGRAYSVPQKFRSSSFKI